MRDAREDLASLGVDAVGMIRSSFLVDEDCRIAKAWYRVKPEDTVPQALRDLST